MKNRKLYDMIVEKYNLKEIFEEDHVTGLSRVGSLLYTITEEEFLQMQEGHICDKMNCSMPAHKCGHFNCEGFKTCADCGEKINVD